jgi:protein-tyrosine phosphatase
MERFIPLQGCFNFRDLGGYVADGGTTRWRTVFRSDALGELTAEDAVLLNDELRVTTVVDLRSDLERRSDGPHPLAGARVVHASIIDEANGEIFLDTSLTLAQRYARVLETGGAAVVTAFEAIAEAPESCVFHCTAGKDRAGMMSALLLGLTGVGDADIVADYVLTQRNLALINERLRNHPDFKDLDTVLPADVLGAEATTMAGLLEELRAAHGGIEPFLKGLGVGSATVDRIKERLVA